MEQEGVSITLRRYGVGRERVIGTLFLVRSEELGVRSEGGEPSHCSYTDGFKWNDSLLYSSPVFEKQLESCFT